MIAPYTIFILSLPYEQLAVWHLGSLGHSPFPSRLVLDTLWLDEVLRLGTVGEIIVLGGAVGNYTVSSQDIEATEPIITAKF